MVTPEPGVPAGPLQITDDGWFTERAREFEAMDREQLLAEARRWAWNAQQATISDAQYRAGTRAITRDIERRLAKAKYLARSGRKTIRADDLKVILDDCSMCGAPGEVVRNGYVHCGACRDQLDAAQAAS